MITQKINPVKPCYTALMILMLFSVFAGVSIAGEYSMFHRGTRPLGMGGAFTAVADDHNAIYFNPAGLSAKKGFGLGILNPQIAVSENSMDLYEDLNDVESGDSDAVAEMLRKYVGENNHIQAAVELYLGFNVGNAGVMISGIGQGTGNVRVRDPVWPEAHMSMVADYGILAGAGIELPFLKGLSVGATLKSISRTSLDEVYSADVIADDNFEDIYEDDQKDGTGVSVDIGLLYTTDVLKFTTMNLGVVGMNLPEMDFGEARDAKSQYNVGIAFQQKLLGMKITEALDVYDVTDNAGSDDSDEKKVHAGVEVELPILLTLRAGLNQGYYTAGATLDFKIVKVDVATYGEELGVVADQKEDRRYVGQISMGWLW